VSTINYPGQICHNNLNGSKNFKHPVLVLLASHIITDIADCYRQRMLLPTSRFFTDHHALLPTSRLSASIVGDAGAMLACCLGNDSLAP
jgi:hypothetical protein